MGEFRKFSEAFLQILEERIILGKGPAVEEIFRESPFSFPEKGIRAHEIPEVIGQIGRGVLGLAEEINCYPGIPVDECYNIAFFISLSPPRAKGRGHLSCREAMEKIVQHMHGSCHGKTKFAVFLTDNWDAKAFSDWKSSLHQIQKNAHLEIYLLTERVSEIFV